MFVYKQVYGFVYVCGDKGCIGDAVLGFYEAVGAVLNFH